MESSGPDDTATGRGHACAPCDLITTFHIFPRGFVETCRLLAIRSDIESLEAKHVEEVANELNFKVHELAANERGALERLNSLKDEDPNSPGVHAAKENYRRASSDAIESKQTNNSAKNDLNILTRLRKDERQLLNAIFSCDEEWKSQPEIAPLYESIRALQTSVMQHQQVVANIKSAARLLEIAHGSLSEGQEASAQARLRSAVELFPQLQSAIGSGPLTSQVVGHAHQTVVEALTAAEQLRMQEEFKPWEEDITGLFLINSRWTTPSGEPAEPKMVRKRQCWLRSAVERRKAPRSGAERRGVSLFVCLFNSAEVNVHEHISMFMNTPVVFINT